jgi:hypothetical protein
MIQAGGGSIDVDVGKLMHPEKADV